MTTLSIIMINIIKKNEKDKEIQYDKHMKKKKFSY